VPLPAPRKRLSELLARPESELRLDQAALLVACEEYPELDVEGYLRRLDALGARARGLLTVADPLEARIAALNQLLFDNEGFRGNVDEYYDPRNSFLNEVLDRRKGIPITLSVVYMEVGRRAGLRVEGLGFPGHFLVRVSGDGPRLVVDPFGGGAILDEAGCQQRLDRVYGGQLRMEPGMLQAVGTRLILARMLRNLKSVYVRQEDWIRSVRVLDLLLLIQPDSVEDLRDRGILYAALECYGPAADDLEAYLERVPGAPEAGKLLPKIVELRRRAARLN
jgi:regulator of sirC expression with transglutaminase-like and TPR domain